MGDVADMILDGTLCEWCGVVLEDGNDWPHLCGDCQLEKDLEDNDG